MSPPTPPRSRPAIGRLTRWLPFELLVSLRFLREGRMQSVLILAGVTGGVAVIIFLTQLINQLQNSIIDRVMGSQAHIVVRPTEEVTRTPPPPQQPQPAAQPTQATGTVATAPAPAPVTCTCTCTCTIRSGTSRVIETSIADKSISESAGADFGHTSAITRIIQPRAQRLRPVDQWEKVAELAAASPGVLAVSPLATGPVFAQRGATNKSVVLMGVVPEAYSRIVKMDGYMTQGRFAVQGTETLIGTELAKDMGVGVGDKLRVTTATGRSETLHIGGLFDTGNRDLNRRWVFVPLKLAQTLLDMPGGVSQIDLTVTDLFNADTVANSLQARTGLTVESWMQTNAGLLAALSQPDGVQQPDPQLRGHHRGPGYFERTGGQRGAKAARNRHFAGHGRGPGPHHGGVFAARRAGGAGGFCPGQRTGPDVADCVFTRVPQPRRQPPVRCRAGPATGPHGQPGGLCRWIGRGSPARPPRGAHGPGAGDTQLTSIHRATHRAIRLGQQHAAQHHRPAGTPHHGQADHCQPVGSQIDILRQPPLHILTSSHIEGRLSWALQPS
jgi:ABC-type lipoprotein release transport system permease subunit